jgi:hypothetical protein
MCCTGQIYSWAQLRRQPTQLCVLHLADLFLYGCAGNQCNGQTAVAGVSVGYNGSTYSYGVATTDATRTPHADGDYYVNFEQGAAASSLACHAWDMDPIHCCQIKDMDSMHCCQIGSNCPILQVEEDQLHPISSTSLHAAGVHQALRRIPWWNNWETGRALGASLFNFWLASCPCVMLPSPECGSCKGTNGLASIPNRTGCIQMLSAMTPMACPASPALQFSQLLWLCESLSVVVFLTIGP